MLTPEQTAGLDAYYEALGSATTNTMPKNLRSSVPSAAKHKIEAQFNRIQSAIASDAIITTRPALRAAFAEWVRRYEADPSGFLTFEEIKGIDPHDYASLATVALIKFLDQTKDSATPTPPVPTTDN